MANVERTAERLSAGKKTRRIEIVADCAIKGDSYKGGELLDLYEDLAIACVHQRLARFVEAGKKSKSE